MRISRRTFVATGAATVILPLAPARTPAKPTKTMRSGPRKTRAQLIDETVGRLQRLFPPPSSTNTHMGFQMRKGMMRKELDAYLMLFRRRFRARLNADHLFAAGVVIHASPLFFSKTHFPLPKAIVVTEGSFASILAAAYEGPVARWHPAWPVRKAEPAGCPT